MYVFSEAIDSRAGFLGYVRVFRGQGKQGVCYAMYVFSEARESRDGGLVVHEAWRLET